ncbi:hypothetical protein T492DRAFT_1052467 [Pavlovales sp. CCMP2436]|nr:hypothetical protein T492DRAFT_1052467 [Pavlovales sp. CCMP2436]
MCAQHSEARAATLAAVVAAPLVRMVQTRLRAQAPPPARPPDSLALASALDALFTCAHVGRAALHTELLHEVLVLALAGVRSADVLARMGSLKLLGCALAATADDRDAWGPQPAADELVQQVHETLASAAKQDVSEDVRRLAEGLLRILAA